MSVLLPFERHKLLALSSPGGYYPAVDVPQSCENHSVSSDPKIVSTAKSFPQDSLSWSRASCCENTERAVARWLAKDRYQRTQRLTWILERHTDLPVFVTSFGKPCRGPLTPCKCCILKYYPYRIVLNLNTAKEITFYLNYYSINSVEFIFYILISNLTFFYNYRIR